MSYSIFKKFYWLTFFLLIGCVLLPSSKIKSDDQLLGLPALVYPQDNPYSISKEELGRKLFFDNQLSLDRSLSCASCHKPDQAFADAPNRISPGFKGRLATRNAPSIMMVAYQDRFLWDGIVKKLEHQIATPLLSYDEMAMPGLEQTMDRLRKDISYQALVREAFQKELSRFYYNDMIQAIATFERGLASANSRFDRWYYRSEKTLTESEIRGYNLFVGEARCLQCHTITKDYALLTDNGFHNKGIGINLLPAKTTEHLTQEILKATNYRTVDLNHPLFFDVNVAVFGRFGYTLQKEDIGKFKTPSLRNVALTAPYMHDGSLATLEDVVRYMSDGGVYKAGGYRNPNESPLIEKLNLNQNKQADVVAFLKTLTSQKFEK